MPEQILWDYYEYLKKKIMKEDSFFRFELLYPLVIKLKKTKLTCAMREDIEKKIA